MKNEFTEFEKEYFFQTRNDIASEKEARERMFNYAVLLFNGQIAAYAILNKFEIQSLTLDAFSLTFFTMLMFSVSGLFYARHRKLIQISHRWIILQEMLIRKYGEEYASRTVESRVMTTFVSKSYLRKDKILGLSILIPIYAFLLVHCSYNTPTMNICAIVIITLHFLTYWFLIFKKIKIGHKIYNKYTEQL